MRFFHWMILAYSLVCVGCGFQTVPVWRDTPKQESTPVPSPQSQESKPEKVSLNIANSYHYCL